MIRYQPGPSASEKQYGGGRKIRLEPVKSAEGGFDGMGDIAPEGHILFQGWPEKGVAGMPSAVIADGCPDIFRNDIQLLEQILDRT